MFLKKNAIFLTRPVCFDVVRARGAFPLTPVHVKLQSDSYVADSGSQESHYSTPVHI